MSRQGLCIALVGYGTPDTNVALALADRVGSIVLRFSNECHDAAALAGLLNTCRNVNYLHLHRRSIIGLAALLDRPLTHVRHVSIKTHPSPAFRAHELTALLMHLPSLRHVSLLPRLSDSDSLALHWPGPAKLHLGHIDVSLGLCIALPLLLTRRWTARSVDIRLCKRIWECLEFVDWTAVGALPEIATLCLHIEQSHEQGPAPALSLIAACSKLRVLQLGASVAEIAVMMPVVFSSCRGLQRLELHLTGLAVQPQGVVAFDALRTHAIRSLHALRSLDIFTRRNAHLLADLVAFCRLRRIACRVREAR